MRTLNPLFEKSFTDTTALYHPILEYVIKDSDLDLQIRNDGKKDYINIYYKGNSILKLNSDSSYNINKKFVANTKLNASGKLINNNDVADYLINLPILKSNVLLVKNKRPSLEIEFEQLFVRVNNMIHSVNSEYYITDRQFADAKNKLRFDLTGIYWSRKNRSKNRKSSLAFFELKYSNNPDIKDIDKQISKYYNYISQNIDDLAKETESLLKTKTNFGLLKQNNERLNALKTLSVSKDINDVVIIIVLIDYNPHSTKFDINKLKVLPFRNQIRLFKTGFAVWERNLDKI